MIDLTDVNVVSDLLKRAVAEKGADYVYPGSDRNECNYFDDENTPSCIVGHVLLYAGYHPNERFMNTVNADVNVNGLPEDQIATSDITARMLLKAQRNQDEGFSWGEALDAAGVK